MSIANDIIDGTVCQHCTKYIGEGYGYPRSCAECGADDDNEA